MIKQLRRWSRLLLESSGANVKRALLRAEIERPRGLWVAACADACFGDKDPSGLGGFCHGLFWHFLVPEGDYEVLHTPILEFLATSFNVLAFHKTFRGFVGESFRLLLRTDAITTALTLPHETERSPLLIAAFQWLREREEWIELAPHLSVAHLFGDANPFSDRISRSRWREFHRLCAQVNVAPSQVQLPDSCFELYQAVVEHARVLHFARRPPPMVMAGSGRPSFLERMRGEAAPPPLQAAAAPGLASGTTPADEERPSAAARQSFLERMRGSAQHPTTAPLALEPQLIGGLRLPPRPPLAAPTSRVALAGRFYARARAEALAAGPDPNMALRASIADLHRTAEAIEEYNEYGVNANTSRKDERAWELWEDVCARLETSPLRTAADVRDQPDRQVFLLACLMMHAFAIGKPRGRDRDFIKPRSALAYPLAIIRVYGRWGISLPGYKTLVSQLHGLLRLYLAYHGPHSLSPRRAEPMRFEMVRRMVAIPIDGSVIIGRQRWTDSEQLVFIFRRLVCFLMVTGFRLGEIVAHTSLEIMFLTRACVSWIIANVVVADPTPAQLATLKLGDLCLVAPSRAKPDQWGEIHCSMPVTLPFDPSDPINSAAAIRDIELRTPCHGAARETTPLFADENGQPYTHGKLDPFLRMVLTFLYSAATAALFTWHSFRSGLATALHAAGCPDAMIQLICRWMCPESLHIYRRMGTAEHAGWSKKAASADVNLIQQANVPIVAADHGYAKLLQELKSTSQSRAATADFAAAAAGQPADRAAPAARPVPPPAPADLRPLAHSNAVGRRVLIPRHVWPRYACTEHGGRGWEATDVSATGVTVVVEFAHATDATGRSYQNERLPYHSVEPL